MRLLIAGDLCPQYRVADLMEQGHYDDIVGQVRAIIGQADYSLVNLECPVVKDEASPIQKCGPNLKTTEKCIELIKYAGFKGVTLANNHFLDYGETGVSDTLAALDDASIAYVGGGINLTEASRIMYIDSDDGKVAVINCCEHEFSIAAERSAGSNPLNPMRQWYDIQEAKRNAAYVVVIVHGGHEHYNLPSPRMQETYRFFIDLGVDAVVNHHQHCYSGYEVYRGKPIVYGLGNFCFDENCYRNSSWNEGYLAMLTINEGNIALTAIPYTQCNEEATVIPMEDKARFETAMADLNRIISNAAELKHRHEEWMAKDDAWYKLAFEPYSNKYLCYAYDRGLLPSFIQKRKAMQIFNYLKCEAHRDRILYTFERLTSKP